MDCRVRPQVQIALLLLFAAFSDMALANSSIPMASIAGLWKFGMNSVWIQINSDGSALQCRIAPGGTVYTSRGAFVSPGTVRWKAIWGVDNVSLASDQMTLHGKWGDFTYHRSEQPMSPICTTPSQI